MNIRTSVLALCIAIPLSACQNFDTGTLMQSGAQAFQAATLSDEQVKRSAINPASKWTKKPKSRLPAAPTPSV